MSSCGTRLLFEFFLDERVKVLTAYEKIDLQVLMVYAARRRGEPGVIPAMPLPRLSRKTGIPARRLEKRLEKFTLEELVTIREDGGWELDLFEDEPEEERSGGEAREYPGEPIREYPGEPILRGSGAERTARWRVKNGNGNGHSNGNGAHPRDAYLPKSDAQASQNHEKASHKTSQSVTQNVTEASQPSYTRDDNVQRLSPSFKNLNSNTESETLNDSNANVACDGDVTFCVTPPSTSSLSIPRLPPNLRAQGLTTEAVRIARHLKDDLPRPGYPQGSIPRHYQLLAVCEEHGLGDLVQKALNSVARKQSRGGLRAPGAFYCNALVRMLGEHNVHVPTKEELDAQPAEDVRRLIQESLAAGAKGITPLEDIIPETDEGFGRLGGEREDDE